MLLCQSLYVRYRRLLMWSNLVAISVMVRHTALWSQAEKPYTNASRVLACLLCGGASKGREQGGMYVGVVSLQHGQPGGLITVQGRRLTFRVKRRLPAALRALSQINHCVFLPAGSSTVCRWPPVCRNSCQPLAAGCGATGHWSCSSRWALLGP